MAQDNMIMGDPPDLEAKSRKWFFILFILILLLALGGYLYFLNLQRKSDSQIALNKTTNTTENDTKNSKNKIKEFNVFENDNPSGKNDLSETVSTVGQKKPASLSKNRLNQGKNGKEIESFLQLNPDPPENVDNSKLSTNQTSGPSAILGFEYRSTELNPSARSVISEIATRIRGKKGRLILAGHTCSLGSQEVNVVVSEKRVKKVEDLFRKMGLGINIRMDKFYFGESRPISTNETSEGRTLNRRVTVRFIPGE
jgi:outer membrane protein OmpA-like peptidoglycan-associated protein